MHYYIVAPANIESGGPELAHQLCRELVLQGQNAYMYYAIDKQYEPQDVPACEKYLKYETSHVTDIDELKRGDAVMIIPEGLYSWIYGLPECKKILWWMSVDNFFVNGSVKDLENIKQQAEYHLVQSRYAYEFLKNFAGVPEEKIITLSDYIGEQFLQPSEVPDSFRQNIILYNPKKGYENIAPVRERSSELRWVPLMGMSEKDMALLMHIAKVYIDFGRHPGKDRIPREAAACGCCVITNKEGSAAFYEDVAIPEQYKFKEMTDYEEINALLQDICNHFEEHTVNFDTYRAKIREEHAEFQKEVTHFLNIMG